MHQVEAGLAQRARPAESPELARRRGWRIEKTTALIEQRDDVTHALGDEAIARLALLGAGLGCEGPLFAFHHLGERPARVESLYDREDRRDHAEA